MEDFHRGKAVAAQLTEDGSKITTKQVLVPNLSLLNANHYMHLGASLAIQFAKFHPSFMEQIERPISRIERKLRFILHGMSKQ